MKKIFKNFIPTSHGILLITTLACVMGITFYMINQRISFKLETLDAISVRSKFASGSQESENFATFQARIEEYPHDVWLREPKVNCDGLYSEEKTIILIITSSAAADREGRDLVRKTWGQFANNRNPTGARMLLMNSLQQRIGKQAAIDLTSKVHVLHFFLLGIDPNKPRVDYIHSTEQQERNDLIVVDFQDTYYNLTYKTVSLVAWVYHRCPEATWVAKSDQDTFVDVSNLVLKLREIGEKSFWAMLGKVEINRPVRRSGKFKVSRSELVNNRYPIYCNGPFYVFSGILAKSLLSATTDMPYFRFEDVYMGMLGQRISPAVDFIDIKVLLTDVSTRKPQKFIGAKDVVAVHHGYSYPNYEERYRMWTKRLRYQIPGYDEWTDNISSGG